MWRFRLLLPSILFSAACFFVAVPAAAQDANIETRLDALLPPPTGKVLRPSVREVEETQIERVEVGRRTVEEPRSGAELRTLLQKSGKIMPLAKMSRDQLCKAAQEANITCTEKRTKIDYRTVEKKVVRKIAEPAKASFSIAVPTNYSYLSNAFAAPIALSDRVLAAAPEATLLLPVNTTDTIGVFVSLGLLRYDEFATLDRDVVTGMLSYGRALSKQEKIVAKYTERSSWRSGFSVHTATTRTPAVEWSLEGINIGGPTCGGANCFVARLGAAAGHTWFESVPALDNAFAGVSAGLDWNIRPGELVLRLGGGITGRVYEHNPDDRDDITYSLSAALAWVINPNVSMTAAITYTRLDSSISAVEWEGYQLLPQVRISAKLGEWER